MTMPHLVEASTLMHPPALFISLEQVLKKELFNRMTATEYF